MSDYSKERVINDVWDQDAASLRLITADGSGNSLYLDSLSWEIRFDYDTRTDGQPVYVGYATAGTATSAATWILHKFTYTAIGGTDFVTRRQVTTNSWDDRATSF